MLDKEKLIAKVDALTPNQYNKEQKLNWIEQLDHKIDVELRQTHIMKPGEQLENPYEDDMYAYWLKAMIDQENAEIAKYNQQITLFNSTYSEYESYVNRNYFPKQPCGGNRFHF